MELPEKYIQKQVESSLISKGFLVIRQNSGANVFEAKGKKRFIRYYSVNSEFLLKKLTAGISDLIAIKQNNGILRILFLEIKTEKGRQSESQKKFEDLLKNHKLEYYMIRSIEQLKALL